MTARIEPAPVFSDTATCECCEGTGLTSHFAPARGEAFDGDFLTVECDACGGSGVVDAVCDCCHRMVPTWQDNCRECLGLVVVERISPTRLVA